MAKNYEILINAPKRVPLTKKDFYELSYYGLGSLFCNYHTLFHYTDDGDLKMYTNKWCFPNCINRRFKDIIWYINESTELYNCTIKKDMPLFKTIEKYFSDLIMI